MLPATLLTVSDTVYVPTFAKVWSGFWSVAFSSLPSPKSHAQVRGGVPEEMSVNVIVRWAKPDCGHPVKYATGAAETVI